MKTLFTTMLLCVAARTAFATAQIPETLFYKGLTYDLYAVPLDSFFSTARQQPAVFRGEPHSTACWRGYVGAWQIVSNTLCLVSLRQGYPGTNAIPLEQVQPGWVAPVKADWFSGVIRIGAGRQVMGGMGFSTTRETELILDIKDGLLVRASTARAYARSRADFVFLCDVLEESPHAHGPTAYFKSYRVKYETLWWGLEGIDLLMSAEIWLHFDSSAYPDVPRSGHEAAFRKGDRFIAFVDYVPGAQDPFRVVRLDPIEAKDDILKDLEKEGALP